MNKIYFGINGQFGDIVIQEPTLRHIVESNPDKKIVLGCYKKYKEILDLYEDYHPNVVERKIWDGYNDWPTLEDSKYIKSQNFEHIYNPMPKHKEKDWALKRHQVAELADMYDLKIDDIQIRLKMPKDVKPKKKTVSISLFASDWVYNGIKSVDMFSVVNVVKYLHKLGYKIIHLNGPNEPDIPLATKVNKSYLDSVKAMLETDFLITVDTGMSWVASAYQHPVIGLYSWGYNPVSGTSKNWQPINPNATYLESRTAKDISPKQIVEAIHDKIRELK